MALPHLGVAQEVRVCDGCWMKKKIGIKSVTALESQGLGGGLEYVQSTGSKPTYSTSSSNTAKTSSTANGSSASNNASKSAAEAEDADLLKAIELSLQEANTQPGYSAPKRSNAEPAKKVNTPATADEEDADLRAAIEASLRETSIHSSSSATPRTSQRQSTYSSYTYSKKPTVSVNTIRQGNQGQQKDKADKFSCFTSLS